MIYASMFSRWPLLYARSFSIGHGCSIPFGSDWASVMWLGVELDEFGGVQSESFALGLMCSQLWWLRA